MAFIPKTPNPDEGKVSEYNAAAFKMKRLHDINSLLNKININLLAYNSDYGVYNYELKFALCDDLYQEVESKLNETESKELEKYREALETFMNLNPIFTFEKSNAYPYKTKTKINGVVWRVIKKFLFEYELRVRKLIDEHGMDTKYSTEDDDPY